jgi:RimJ/RimL family protein N-acetyltransferase
MPRQLKSARLTLAPLSHDDFELFVRDMLTDPKTVAHFPAYRELFDLQQMRVRAERDFWRYFETSNRKYGYEIWSIFEGPAPKPEAFIGWAGLVHGALSDQYGGPELQYMLTSRVFGKGYGTEAARLVMDDARQRQLAPKLISVTEIGNKASIRLLEKLGFEFVAEVEAYNSDMYLYAYSFS